MPKILIADDQPDVLAALRLLLKGESYDIIPASSPASVMKVIETPKGEDEFTLDRRMLRRLRAYARPPRSR